MNLTNLFNFNYLKQNVKKSKVILSIFIGLIPILNTIILIMEFDNNNNQVFNFQNISVINYIGIYFLPIIVSICLFNYVYKKKSVDFINSMPITRKSIFVTNTIFGIIIFLAMLIINIILLKVLTLIFGIQIPFMMFIDYLWFWFVVYMFVFSATNLAMSVSGNAITQIVLTLLIIFLVPFTTSFMKTINSQYKDVYLECTSDECMMESYYCYDNLECAVNKQLNLYKMYDARKIKKTNYTSPFAFINVFSYNNSSSIINFISVVKMIILTIIYIVLGYIMFLRRKMEVSETSFKNIHVHNIVRSLTLIPIIAIFYEILKEENLISIIFVLVLMLVYYFVYDLLTKKSINHIKISLIYFVLATTIITTTYGIVDKVGNEEDENILKYNDIKEIAIKLPNSYNEDKIYVNDKNILSTVIKSQSDMDMGIYVTSYIKTKNNEEYEIRNYLSKENYNKVLTLLSNNETYSKNYKQINNDKIFAVSVGRKIYSKKDSKKILDLVNETLNKMTLKEQIELQRKYNNINSNEYIKIYSYENHDIKEQQINGYISYDIINYIVNNENSVLKNDLEKIIPSDFLVYYSSHYFKDDYDIDYYLMRKSKDEIYNFILNNVNNNVDMNKEFLQLEVSFKGMTYNFTTNNVSEFKDILDNKGKELENDSEYQEYLKEKQLTENDNYNYSYVDEDNNYAY